MENVEYSEVEEVPMNGLQTYQQDKAMVDMQIVTAKRYPRDLDKCITNAITIVTMSKEIAESCTYTLPKGKKVTGPSVYLARIVAREMGNMRVENEVVGFDATHVTCKATCFDLEKNYAVRTTIKKSIVGNSGKFSPDMQVITGNAGNAIAFRNAVFAVVSPQIINKVWDAAKKKITGDLSDETKLIARRNTIVEGFKQTYHAMNLTDEEIAKSVGRVHINHITKDDVLVLIGYENSFRSGEITPEEVFRPKTPFTQTTPNKEDKSEERILKLIDVSKDRKTLEKLAKDCTTAASKQAYDAKWKELK